MGALEIDRLLAKHGEVAYSARLCVLTVDGARVPCDSWAGPFSDEAKRLELLEDVEERALRQANLLGGSHAFWLELFDHEKVPLGTEVFRVSAEATPDGKSLASEPANLPGITAQMMRQNENLHRVVLSHFRDESDRHRAEIQDARARQAQLEDKVFKGIEIVQEALLGEREHQLAIVKANARADLQKELMGSIKGLLPEVAAGVIHKQAGAPAAAAAVGIKGLIDTLTPEQFEGIAALLKPEQQILLVQAMRRIAEADATAKAQEKADGSTPL